MKEKEWFCRKIYLKENSSANNNIKDNVDVLSVATK